MVDRSRRKSSLAELWGMSPPVAPGAAALPSSPSPAPPARVVIRSPLAPRSTPPRAPTGSGNSSAKRRGAASAEKSHGSAPRSRLSGFGSYLYSPERSLAKRRGDTPPPSSSSATASSDHVRSPLMRATKHGRFSDHGSYLHRKGGALLAPQLPPAADTSDAVPAADFRWKRGELLGQGGFGSVSLGLNLDTGALMAVKEVHFSAADQSLDELRLLHREVLVMRSLTHRNIVRYLGAARQADLIQIFAEWVPGGCIAKLLRSFGPLSARVARNYARQILAGLQYLHSNDIAHLDVKPANCLVNDRGTVKLADFGSSRRLARGATKRRRGAAVAAGTAPGEPESGDDDCGFGLQGTPYFLAPERIREDRHTCAADLWSAGGTLLNMLSGHPPWRALRRAPSRDGLREQEQLSSLLNSNSKSSCPPPSSEDSDLEQRCWTAADLFMHIATATSPPPLPSGLGRSCRKLLLACFERDDVARPTAAQALRYEYFRAPEHELSKPTAAAVAHSSGVQEQAGTLSNTPVGKHKEEEQDDVFASFLTELSQSGRNRARRSLGVSLKISDGVGMVDDDDDWSTISSAYNIVQ